MSIQDLESYFNLVSKVKDTIVMMSRADAKGETPEFKNINNKYYLILNEVNERINALYKGETVKKEILNEEMAH